MRSFVAISNDLTVAVTTHDSILGPATPTIEAPVPIFWPIGMATGHNKLTYSVKHQGLPLATKGHDCGPGIGHTHVPPDPASDALLTIASSRKSTFATSSVRGQKQPLAACGMLNTAPTPMLTCSDPISTLQLGAVTLLKNTATFGISPADLVAGYADAFSEMAIDGIGAAVGERRGNMVGWAAKMVAKNAKKLGLQAYKWHEEGGALDFSLELDAPVVGGNVWKRGLGPRRDASGNWSWFESAQTGPYKVTMDFELIDGLFGDEKMVEVEFEYLRESEDGSVSVERDGEIVTYESGLGTDDDTFNTARHGRPSVKDK